MRKRRKPTIPVILAIALIAVAMVVAARLAFYTPGPREEVFTAEDAVRARKSIDAMVGALKKVTRDAMAGKRKDFRIKLAQRDVNCYLRSGGGAGELGGQRVEQPQVEFQEGTLKTSGYITYHGHKVYVTATGKLTRTAEGKPMFHTESVTLGRIPAPGAVLSMVDDKLNDYVSATAGKVPATITKVTTDNGTLSVEGLSDPNAAR